jgi:hypothetical protein
MIDIIRYHILVFKKANYIFAAMTIQLKWQSLGKVDSTPVIELDELKQLYNSTGMNIYTLLAFLKDKINMSLVRLL